MGGNMYSPYTGAISVLITITAYSGALIYFVKGYSLFYIICMLILGTLSLIFGIYRHKMDKLLLKEHEQRYEEWKEEFLKTVQAEVDKQEKVQQERVKR